MKRPGTTSVPLRHAIVLPALALLGHPFYRFAAVGEVWGVGRAGFVAP